MTTAARMKGTARLPSGVRRIPCGACRIAVLIALRSLVTPMCCTPSQRQANT